jgi:hypothetical protein
MGIVHGLGAPALYRRSSAQGYGLPVVLMLKRG